MRVRSVSLILLLAHLLVAGCSTTPEEEALAVIQGVGGSVRADAQGNIVSVDLSDTPVRDNMLAAIAVFPHVQTINCTNAHHITGSGLAALRGLNNLETLYLVDTQVDDAGLRHVRHLTSLKTLQLGHTQITDAGMPALDSLEQLQTLSIANTAVSDKGLVQLRDLRHLSTLILRDTKTTRSGVQELRRMLPEVRVVD
jgi:Leucine-rich repeat (LRR) protein